MIVVGRHVFFRAVLRWGAALAFCYPLKHRERFWLRAVELLLSLMALTWLLDPMAQSNSLVQLQISLLGMYVGFFYPAGCHDLCLCGDRQKECPLLRGVEPADGPDGLRGLEPL